MKRAKPLLRLAAGCAVLLVACVLPGEPSDDERIEFQLDFALPYRVPLAGTAEPAIRITAGGQALSNPRYRLESLDEGVLRVDATGRGLEGVARGAAAVRVLYQTATGTPDTVFPVQVVVSRIAVGPADTSLTRLGATTQLSATAYDAKDATVPNVAFTWSSADRQVAIVNPTGLVRAVDEGTVAIAAEADSVKGLASVTVTQVAAQVQLAPELDTLRTVGRSAQFIALAFDSTGQVLQGAKPRWTSSDPLVATVDAGGRATATGAGTVRIVARVGEAADTATLVVAQVLRFLVVTPGYDTLTAIADTGRLVALAFDSLNFPIPNPSVGWATSDAAVATVDEGGLVRAERNGVVLVTASTAGQSAFATVVVRQEAVVTRLSQDSIALTNGDTVRLSAVGLDRNGYPVNGAQFTWHSDIGCVATVDGSGLVTARGGGRTYIVAAPANAGRPDTVGVRVTGAPDQGVIAFFSRRGIETICGDGSQRTLLIPLAHDETPLDPLVGEPSWSLDGATIAFSQLEEMGSLAMYRVVPMSCRVYTARADGSEVRPLPLYPSQCNRHPAWSPDGQRVAFAWGLYCFVCVGTWSISVVNADGSNLRELLPHQDRVEYTYPTWSPDGTRLAFQGPSDSGSVVMVINADGTGLANLTTHQTGRHYDHHPTWSPDGLELAFVRDWGDIWVMNADGSDARNLTSSPANDVHPAWSPDGLRIVFASGPPGPCEVDDWEGGTGGDCDLYVINRDGTGLRRLTATHDWEIHPSWRRTAPPQAPSTGPWK